LPCFVAIKATAKTPHLEHLVYTLPFWPLMKYSQRSRLQPLITEAERETQLSLSPIQGLPLGGNKLFASKFPVSALH